MPVKGERHFGLGFVRLASQQQSVGTLDAPGVIFLGIGGEPLGQGLRPRHHERAVQQKKLLRGGRANGPFLGVDVGVRIIELHENVVQFEPANPRMDRAAKIGRVVQFQRSATAEVELTTDEQRRVAPLLDGEAAPVPAPEQVIGGIVFGVAGVRGGALPVGGGEGELAHE